MTRYERRKENWGLHCEPSDTNVSLNGCDGHFGQPSSTWLNQKEPRGKNKQSSGGGVRKSSKGQGADKRRAGERGPLLRQGPVGESGEECWKEDVWSEELQCTPKLVWLDWGGGGV